MKRTLKQMQADLIKAMQAKGINRIDPKIIRQLARKASRGGFCGFDSIQRTRDKRFKDTSILLTHSHK